MDNYTEQILVRKPAARERLMMVGSVAVIVVGVCIWLLFNKGGIGISLAIIGGVLVAYAKKNQMLEYEYIFTNEDCEITRIVNRESRKALYSFNGGEIQRVLKYDSIKYDNLLQSDPALVIKDYTSGFKGKEDRWYVFVNNGSNRTMAIVMELNDKSEEYIKTVYKKKYDEQLTLLIFFMRTDA